MYDININEEWRDVVGYEGYYLISNKGKVYSCEKTIYRKNGTKVIKQGKIMKQNNGKSGYKTVRLSTNSKGKTVTVHTLVAMSFLESAGECVNHKDGDKHNNDVDNLEWVTYSDNNRHALDNRLRNCCKKVFVSDIDNNIINIFSSISDASKRLGVSGKIIKKYTENGGIVRNMYKFKTIKDNEQDIIFFSRTHVDSIIPNKTIENGGYDVYAVFDGDEVIIKSGEIYIFNTGICSCFSSKYVGIGKERGSTGTIGMSVRSMVIDSGYRGEWLVPINNTTDKTIVISKKVDSVIKTEDTIYYPYKKAICQVCIQEVPELQVQEVDDEFIKSQISERGVGKFGSTKK